MYELNDTIVAVSSPTPGRRVIVRLTGPKTVETCGQIFKPSIPKKSIALVPGNVVVDPELTIDAVLYLYLAPHSYTGDDVAEIHIYTNPSVTDALMGNLLNRGLRMAGPGEFTARAYLNGKIDLAQAEAVNEVIVSSNRYQLAAAEKLLSGRLAETTIKIRSEMCDCLGLIEAGLDFSQEDIEFITREEGVEKLAKIKKQLEQLLSGSISYEAVIDLPAVGIAGAPNAGKSSLLNKLLGKPRSIISDQRRTTRDVLTGLLTLRHCRCVLFDCAGLTPPLGGAGRVTGHESRNILDELAQQAAIEALQNSTVVIFCIDISKGTPFCNKSQNGNPPDWAEDIAICRLIRSPLVPPVFNRLGLVARRSSLGSRVTGHGPRLIAVATKSDLLSKDELTECLTKLNDLFGADFLATSAEAGTGIELLKDTIDRKLVELALGSTKRGTRYEVRDTRYGVVLTARHRQAVIEAIENISESISEIKAGNDEVTAMMLRAAYQAISNIEQQNIDIDERVLDNIFSRFCIGK